MPNYAQISLIGHAGKTPELRTTQSGKSVASFSLAVKDPFSDETTWYNCAAFGKTAENYVSKYLKKGDAVFVTGRPSLNTYEKRDGTAGASIEVIINDVQIMGGKKQQDNVAEQAEVEDDLNDEIPF